MCWNSAQLPQVTAADSTTLWPGRLSATCHCAWFDVDPVLLCPTGMAVLVVEVASCLCGAAWLQQCCIVWMACLIARRGNGYYKSVKGAVLNSSGNASSTLACCTCRICISFCSGTVDCVKKLVAVRPQREVNCCVLFPLSFQVDVLLL